MKKTKFDFDLIVLGSGAGGSAAANIAAKNGLKVAITYAIVGSVIAEWLGGEQGLGVYMIRVKKSFAYDKVFAVVIIISLISFMLIKLIEYISKKAMPWNVKEN